MLVHALRTHVYERPDMVPEGHRRRHAERFRAPRPIAAGLGSPSISFPLIPPIRPTPAGTIAMMRRMKSTKMRKGRRTSRGIRPKPNTPSGMPKRRMTTSKARSGRTPCRGTIRPNPARRPKMPAGHGKKSRNSMTNPTAGRAWWIGPTGHRINRPCGKTTFRFREPGRVGAFVNANRADTAQLFLWDHNSV